MEQAELEAVDDFAVLDWRGMLAKLTQLYEGQIRRAEMAEDRARDWENNWQIAEREVQRLKERLAMLGHPDTTKEDAARELAVALKRRLYLDMPCRICGRRIDELDLPDMVMVPNTLAAMPMHNQCYKRVRDLVLGEGWMYLVDKMTEDRPSEIENRG